MDDDVFVSHGKRSYRHLWTKIFLISIIHSISVNGERFVLLEERGSPTRLRFTSGERGYYNATIRELEENSFASNIKLGLYIYDSRTIIKYLIDNTDTFTAESEKIQDFYFLRIKPKAPLNLELKPLHTLNVKALDGITNKIIDETKIYLKVTDVNEWTPSFLNKSLHVVIREDLSVGEVATKVFAEDKDDGLNGQVYYFIPEPIRFNQYFRVHPQSGEILVIRPLDASKKREFYFHVAARDRAPIKAKQFVSTPPLSVRITVREVPGYSPFPYKHLTRHFSKVRNGRFVDIIAAKFSKKVYSASISEIAPPYTGVLRVSIHRTVDGGSLKSAFYGIDNGNEGGHFQIESRTGFIYTVKDLDYERNKQLNFSVIAYYHGAFIGRALVQINVQDGNDHSPEFRENLYKLTVHEDTPVGTKILTVSAIDKDTGAFAELIYTIANTDHVPFTVTPTSGEIMVSGPLDLDSGTIPSTIFLRVRASDQGRPVRRQKETLVEVSVKPVNDNSPVLKYSKCQLTVDRKTPVGTVVLSIPAIDIDYEGMSTFSYAISYSDASTQVFEVNSSTGQLLVAKSLATADEDYKIMFSVSDGKNPTRLKAEVFVKISAGLLSDPESSFTRHNCSISPNYVNALHLVSLQKNVSNSDMARQPVLPPTRNYHSPEFVQESKEVVSIREDLKVGSEIARLSAVDKDLGCYGFVLYSIVSGNIDSSFNIGTYNGSLYLATPLDRETRGSYKIKVRAWDSGMPRNYKDSTVDIVVKDVNDNVPTFKNDTYSVEVFENVRVGHQLLTVSAVDDDEGDNGDVHYHLVNDFGGLFVINSISGVIQTNGSFDYEKVSEYWIDVQAMDSSKDDQKINQISVHVIVKDINDNKPRCIPSSRSLEIPKDFPAGAIVTRVVAVDSDMGRGGIVHYKIGKGRNRKLLSIDDVSGVLTVNTTLSSEKSPFLDVTVVAFDLGVPSLKARCRIRVYLKPVESTEKPVFTTKQSPVYLTVKERTSIGSVVGTLDAKSPTDSDLNYDIVDGTGLGLFTINKNHGVIKTVQQFVNNHNCHYWITVQAFVWNKPSIFTNIPVLIHIDRDKVRPPYFVPSVYRVGVKENLPAKTQVIGLNAVDPDMGLGLTRLRYSIVSGNRDGAFSINGDGFIFTTVHLDYETKTSYVLNVSVVNSQYPELHSFAAVTIMVIDENDHAPRFVERAGYILQGRVFEKKTVSKRQDSPIVQVLALDKDSGANGFIEFSIQQEEPVSKFAIDRYSGQIFATDRLIAGDYTILEVTATDKGTPRRNASTYLEISVYPLPPLAASELYFKQATYTIKMLEMIKEVAEPIDLLNLKDNLVTEDHIMLIFSIVSGNEDGKFYIDDGSQLCVVSKLDYEISPSHRLQISATDGIKHATTTVNVIVGDINDNKPTTSQSYYEVSVMENQRPGQEVIKVEGMDLDRISQGRLIYEIVQGSLSSTKRSFTIEKTTGVIRTAKSFDHEQETKHVMTVKILDQVSLNTSVSIIVNIQDMNDHTPEFVSSNHVMEIDGNFRVGAAIGRVFAADRDSGVNAMLKFSFLSGNDDGFFYIEQQSGIVNLQQSIAVEKRTVFNLMVQVSDHGYPARKANNTIQIIAHPKKPKPAFARKKYTRLVKENQPAGTLVSGDVRVQPDRQVFYYLQTTGDDCFKNFHIDLFSGVITTKVSLDAEKMTSCVFTVTGKNSYGFKDEATVTVIVQDVNDNVPSFLNNTFYGTVVEGYSKGSDVMSVTGAPLKVWATDRDSGDNARVEYRIVESSAQRYFKVNRKTGYLKTAMVLDREKRDQITFHVEASDFGNPKLYSFARLIISVLDINDAMPEFVLPRYSASLYRPVYNNTSIITVKAVDADTAVFGNITYALNDHQDIFHINEATGMIRVLNSDKLLAERYDLTVTASDMIFITTAPVSIKLLQMPNTKFRFQEKSYSPTVKENRKDISTVLVFQTVGYDVGECVKYEILNSNPYFGIDSLSGTVQTKGLPFDRETTPYYILIIQAKVERYFPKVAQVVVNVTISDDNDNRPEFIGVPYFKSIDVNTDVGTKLIKIAAHDKDLGLNSLVRYRILSGDRGVLSINETSGLISMKEKLIKGRAPAKLLLKVQAYDQGIPVKSSETVVELPIVNEDMPIFGQNYNVSVKEGASVGTMIVKITAAGPKGRKVLYSLSKGDKYNIFDVDFNTGELVVIGNVRRDINDRYSLVVQATDSKTGSWSETVCEVTILDSNNHIPMFEKPAYTAEIAENAQLRTSILTLKAVDDDKGTNSELVYSISQNGRTDSPFAIDPRTGEVTLVHKVNYEKRREHRIEVGVTDKGTPPLSSFSSLVVKIQDVNDNPPKFEQEYEFFVDGPWKIGQFIGRVQAIDLDHVSQNRLEYSLVDSPVLAIDAKTGILVLRNDPGDIELLRQRVHCSDGISKVATDVTVRFVPSNRQAPLLSQAKYSLSIQEGADPSFITVVSATDLDQGTLGQIHYTIENRALQSKFHISEYTGDVFSKVSFDREGPEQGPFHLAIRAMDGGGKFSYCEAIVEIADQNDHEPVFEYPMYKTFLGTKEKIGTEILHVKAEDKDSGLNSEITYAINGLESGNPFSFNTKTGTLTLIGEPSGMGYSFVVVAADNGYPMRESRTNIRIEISSQKLISFNSSTYKVDVPEDANPGTRLLDVQATAKDIGEVVEYELVEGNLDSTKVNRKFKIDSSGTIRLAATLDYEQVEHYRVKVKATIPSSAFAAFTMVEVNVKNLNDNPPVFDRSFYEVSIIEDVMIGTRVLLLIATDKDKDDDQGSSRIRYRFATADEGVRNTFSIDSHTGWITVSAKLDWETRKSYEFMMKAQDGRKSTKRLTDYTSVRINIIDVNDSPPSFLHPKFVFSTKEDHIVGQKVAQLLAEDADLNPVLRYYVTKGNDMGLWALNSENGEITLSKPLDRELKDKHELEVVAYDGVFKTTASVVIMLNDTIDNAPVCKKAYYVKEVPEGPASIQSLLQVEAYDPDSSDVLRYSLQGEGAGFFIIDERTGVLSLVTELDYEKQKRYRFYVQATDLGGHSCISDVIIEVTDINDNTPKFSQTKYVATVRENASLTVMMGRVHAVDLDERLNRKISHSLLTDFGKTFSIQERTGILLLEKRLEKDIVANYSLRVRATDHGTPPLSSESVIDVIVLGKSDSPPLFLAQSYSFNVSELSLMGHVVGTVKARSVSDNRLVVYRLESENAKFVQVNPKTGALSLLRPLDFEATKYITFTVMANYERVPTLSSAIPVTIYVKDENDNAPVFQSPFYKRSLDENVRPGTFVAAVIATDADDGTNKELRYQIVDSTTTLPFVINQVTGILSVGRRSQVDREKVSSYRLKIRAEDKGQPKMYTDVVVQVDISDLNDCPPVPDKLNGTVLVQDTKLVGSKIYTLRVTDDDLPQNGPPFHFTITKGDRSKFSMERSLTTPNLGYLVVKGPLRTAEQSEHRITVRIDDSGSPPQSSYAYMTVYVVPESKFAPVIQEPTTFFLLVEDNKEVFVGKVKVTDSDGVNLHQFKITSGNDDGTFRIHDMNGDLFGRPRQGVYTIGVEVTDGKYSDSNTIKILVNEMSQEIYDNSVVVTVKGDNPKTFVEGSLSTLVSLLSQLSGSPVENILVWSVQKGTRHAVRRDVNVNSQTDIALAIRRPDGKEYIASGDLESLILRNRNTLASKLGYPVNIASPAACSSLPCPGNKKCIASVIPVKSSTSAERTSQLLSHRFTIGYQCICQNGRTGPDCSKFDACKGNPCSEGERCVPQDQSFVCECFDSRKCNLLGETVTLDGTGYVGYTLLSPFDVIFKTIKVSFRTEEKEGILFYAQGPDYCILEIKGGRVQYRFDYGSGPAVATVNELQVNDGQWHQVEVKRLGKVASISLDGGKFQNSGKSPGDSVKINLNGNMVFFGAGVVQSSKQNGPRSSVFDGFKGCLRRPTLNDVVLPWTGSNSIVKKAQAFSVQAQCQDSGMCKKIACPYFSECINTLTSYRCECLPGHKGPFCTARVSCHDRPCLNGGQCYYEQIDDKIEYRCRCPPRFTGAQCQVYVGACGSSPCKNRGACVPHGNSFSCNCPARFKGRYCEIDSSPCASSPCLYGTCQQIGSTFQCNCPLGRSGKTCGYGEYCRRTRCENGGRCLEKLNGAICKCTKGYQGPFCRGDINECLDGPPTCKHGTCVNKFGSYFCNCTDGHTGPFCGAGATGRRDTLPLSFLAIVLIGAGVGIIFVLIIGCLCWHCCRSKKRKRRQEALESERMLSPTVKYPYGCHELGQYPMVQPPERANLPPEYRPEDYGAAYLDSTVLYDPQQVGSSGDSMSSQADSCAKRPLSDDGSERDEKLYLRTFDPSPVSTPAKHAKRLPTSIDNESLCSARSDRLQGAYHWDYTGVPEDMVRLKHNRKLSEEGSHLGIPLTEADSSKGEEDYDEGSCYLNDVVTPQEFTLPATIAKPESRRSSIRDDAETNVLVPQIPKMIGLSRQSLQRGDSGSPITSRASRNDRKSNSVNNSPRTSRAPKVDGVHFICPNGKRKYPELDASDGGPHESFKTHLTTTDFKNRYSLTLDDDSHSIYLQDVLSAGYPAPPSETCPSDIETCTKPSLSETHSDPDIHGTCSRGIRPRYVCVPAAYDVATETSYSSDEEGLDMEYLDDESPRKLEKDLKALIRDIEERTNAEV